MATHSSTLAWRIPWKEEPGRLQSMGRKESDMTERLHFHFLGEQQGKMFSFVLYFIIIKKFYEHACTCFIMLKPIGTLNQKKKKKRERE